MSKEGVLRVWSGTQCECVVVGVQRSAGSMGVLLQIGGFQGRAVSEAVGIWTNGDALRVQPGDLVRMQSLGSECGWGLQNVS